MLWLYDPLTIAVLMVAYVVGLAVMTLGASIIAPRVAKRVSGKLSLRASMWILGLAIVVGGLAGILLLLSLVGAFTYPEVASSLAILVVLFVLASNIVTYLVSPWLINIMYSAKRDPGLQKIVNEVALQAGFKKPPKAVLVEGPPNAFAYGNFLAGKWVAVSSEMLRITSDEELKAVVGHELGHHRHGDNAIMLFMGLIPSIIYYLGLVLIRSGLYYSGLSRSERNRGGGGFPLLIVGVAAVAVSFIVQVLVLAFSRLREYYADAHGAMVAGARHMQRALAKLHVYYHYNKYARASLNESKLKALFIYALTEALANPFYSRLPRPPRDLSGVDIDEVIDELRRAETSEPGEFLSTHPPIHKRIKFLDSLERRSPAV